MKENKNKKGMVKCIGKLLDPKIDYVFKRIFGYIGNEEITKELISSIIRIEYENLEKVIVIVILITDYEIDSLKEIKKYETKWNIREEEYQKVILTDVMEFYIIELPKYEKYKEKTENKKLDKWIKFIKEPGGIEMGDDKAIKKQNKC